ncbi:MAG: glycosyltransferase family 1 protein [Deltaproteobacteria bacterium]|nr:glycosyltransferase family 1 protein [Deltaproteobacteria bacterium]
MKRVLLVSSGEKGHVNPLVGVAQHLREAGHHVGWLVIPEPVEQVKKLGVELVRLPDAAPLEEIVTQGPEMSALARDARALRSWIQALLLDAVPAQIEPLRKALRAFKPDVVGTDPMLYQAYIACHEEQIPFAGISSSLNPVTPDEVDVELTRTVRALASARAALFASHGLAPKFAVCDALGPALTTCFATREYVGDAPLRPAVKLVGPTRPLAARGDEVPFPWEKLDASRPFVYLSFGSQIGWQPEIFARVAGVLARRAVPLVINAGIEPHARGLAELPGQVIAVRYAPQRELLTKAAVLVTHGGANSVMEALTAGVPMLISPVCNDQPIQAQFVERAGVGIALDLLRASDDQADAALGALLDPDVNPFKRALAPISAAYRSADGAGEVARLLVELAA